MMFVKIAEDKVVNLAHVIEVRYWKDGSMCLLSTTCEILDIEEPYREQFEKALRRVNEAVIFAAK